jgi:Zn-finger nucleic acid-binding protein
MTCPACGRELTTMTAGPITVDACANGCAGIWLDHFELEKVDEQSEAAGAALLEIPGDPSLSVDLGKRRTCPKCGPEIVLMRHFESVARKVAIDECPECGGIWLDAGELNVIRNEFPSEEARHAAARKMFSEMFDAQLAAEHAKSEAELAGARKVARALRFICPSTYLPDKQDGGAF